MTNISLKSLSVLLCIAVFSHGEMYKTESFALEAGVSSQVLKNKLTGILKIPTFGFHFTVPVGIENTSLMFGAEYGKIKKTEKVLNTSILLSNISLRYTCSMYRDILSLSPSVSLENCALHLQKSGKIDDFVIIANWENEFGIGAGCELLYRWKFCTVSVPLKVSAIFAGESAFIFSCGIRAGVQLLIKRKYTP